MRIYDAYDQIMYKSFMCVETIDCIIKMLIWYYFFNDQIFIFKSKNRFYKLKKKRIAEIELGRWEFV